MKPEIIEDYIEKVYGYAVNHTYTREEADELSQEILLTVIRELPKLRDNSKFEPWLWGIANNIAKSFRRSMSKNRATYSYDVLENVPYEESDEENEDAYDFLRTKIAMLSEIYRIDKYAALVYKFVDGYKNLFPKHLHDDADRMCRNMFLGMYSVIVEYAQRTEQIKMP